MATFCYRCTECDARWSELYSDVDGVTCPQGCTEFPVVRDFKAENVGVHTASLRRARR